MEQSEGLRDINNTLRRIEDHLEAIAELTVESGPLYALVEAMDRLGEAIVAATETIDDYLEPVGEDEAEGDPA